MQAQTKNMKYSLEHHSIPEAYQQLPYVHHTQQQSQPPSFQLKIWHELQQLHLWQSNHVVSVKLTTHVQANPIYLYIEKYIFHNNRLSRFKWDGLNLTHYLLFKSNTLFEYIIIIHQASKTSKNVVHGITIITSYKPFSYHTNETFKFLSKYYNIYLLQSHYRLVIGQVQCLCNVQVYALQICNIIECI